REIKERTLLLYAAKRRHKVMVRLLLKTKKVDIDLKDKGGLMPLSWAARNRDESEIKLLLGNGAKLGEEDKNGRS
ncbi:hypothetical protein BDZ45DRAFT_541241, partial [Acephala macrosclerotiorum]